MPEQQPSSASCEKDTFDAAQALLTCFMGMHAEPAARLQSCRGTKSAACTGAA